MIAKHPANQLPADAWTRLIEHIYAAFVQAPRPRAGGIAGCSRTGCDECRELDETLSPFRARDVPDTQLRMNTSAVPLLRPMAFRYYLPRYLEFSSVHRASDCFLVDSVLYSLSTNKPDEPYWVVRYSVFIPPERRAISDYIATRRTWPDTEFHIEQCDRAGAIWGMGTPVV